MENKVTPAKSGITLGVLFGLIMVLQFVITFIVGIDKLAGSSFGIIINMLNYLILPILFIYLGCTNYKKLNNGFVTFSECLKIGVSISVIAAIIYAIFNLIFNLIFPDFGDQILAITKTEILKKNPNMTSEQMDMALSMTKKFMSQYIVFPVTIVMYAFFGLLYSLIVGAIVKKDPNKSL
jgi:hypothetical protein